MAATRVSVIVPVLDEAAIIAQTLAGMQGLRARGCEVIVADGGSSDATITLAAPLADRIISASAGRARQMNAGAAAAGGDSLLFVHADTRLPPAADRLIGAALADRVWGRFDVRLSGSRPVFRVIERMMNLRSRVTGIATGDQAMFVRRDVFERLGGFALVPLMEDIDLSRRLRTVGRPACLKPPVETATRRWETHGVWRVILQMWALRMGYLLGVSPQRLARRYHPSGHDPS